MPVRDSHPRMGPSRTIYLNRQGICAYDLPRTRRVYCRKLSEL